MRLPPLWVRRPLQVLVVGGLTLGVCLLPGLLAGPMGAGAAAALLIGGAVGAIVLPGRWLPVRALRLLMTVIVGIGLEALGMAAGLLLWIASGFGWRIQSARIQRAHWAVLRLLLRAAVGAARLLLGVRVVDDGTGWSPLDDGVPGSTNAMVVLCRHAGPGDSLLLVETLLDRDHQRLPRIVLKDLLRLDPLVDVYLGRLPSRFLSSQRRPGEDLAAEVGRLAADLGEEDAVVIFPEGGNYTPGRRARAIAKLWSKGMAQEAEKAEGLEHVLPPRPGGVQAALAAAPHADVVLVAHTGLEHMTGLADLWSGLPMDGEVRMRWDFFPAPEVPREPDALSDWLYERWQGIDAWVDEHRLPARRSEGT